MRGIRPGRRRAIRPPFRQVPLRLLVPNVVTLLALCAGLTSIRMALEGRIDMAVYAIVIAAVLDGLDGGLARLMKGTSRFGAELDSLSDFVNFGVAPAIALYVWALSELGSVGWMGALVFTIACALRLARYNTMMNEEQPEKPVGPFFLGVPAPAGAITVLLPIYMGQWGLSVPVAGPVLALAFCIALALLMVSRLPTWSLKHMGSRIRREMIPFLFVSVTVFVAMLVSYPWLVLGTGSLAYLGSLPLAYLREKARARKQDAVPAETAP